MNQDNHDARHRTNYLHTAEAVDESANSSIAHRPIKRSYSTSRIPSNAEHGWRRDLRWCRMRRRLACELDLAHSSLISSVRHTTSRCGYAHRDDVNRPHSRGPDIRPLRACAPTNWAKVTSQLDGTLADSRATRRVRKPEPPRPSPTSAANG